MCAARHTSITQTIAALLLCGAATFAAPHHAAAATTVNSTVSAFGVDYIFFDFDGGALTINVDGISLTDPMIRLFKDDGSAVGALTGASIAVNDDGPVNRNSELNLNLTLGNFVLAVGSFFLDDTEARTGSASSPGTFGTYTATFAQDITVTEGIAAAVPLPASLPLLLAGMGALGLTRRRAPQPLG